jgi:hypothetical protein
MADPQFLAKLNAHFTHHAFMVLPFDLYATKSMRLAIFGNQAPPTAAQAMTDESNPRGLLDSMLNDIRMRGKQAVLVVLPRSGPVERLRAVAGESCIAFIDGDALFRKYVTPQQIADFWPQYEGHWFERGGDRFAELLGPELVRMRALHDVAPNTPGPCK